MARKEAVISVSEDDNSKFSKSIIIKAVLDPQNEPELAWHMVESSRGMPKVSLVTTTQTLINFFESGHGTVVFLFSNFPKEANDLKFPFKNEWSGKGWNYAGDLYVPVGAVIWTVLSLKEW